MNKIVTICAALLTIASVFLPQLSSAQAPEKMSYQAVVRNSSNALVTNASVGMQISILQGSASGTAVYIETQTPTTNANGLVNLEIGNGTVVSGDFATIDWSTSEYYIKTETDPAGGTNYSITGTSQLLSVPYALYAKNVKTYKVGDFAQGGIVFWVDETGQHGLVCAKTDQSYGIRWYAGTYGKTQAKGNGPLAGKANTSIIIAAHVAIGDDGNSYAARICNELQITEGGKTYGDWYLPSKDELNLMYQNRTTITNTATANGGLGFADFFYWSSTDGSSDFAWRQYFLNGYQDAHGKSFTYYVRAVRSF
jgi:hypothetical protein